MVVALLVRLGRLIDRRHQEVRPIEELVLRRLAQGVVIGIFQEHGAYHGQPVHRLLGDAVSIRHDFRLQLQIPAVDGSGGFAQRVGIFLVGAPSVHVQLHRGEGLPLEVAGIHRHVLSAEDAVHVRADVGIAR